MSTISGRSALREIDKALDKTRDVLASLDREFGNARSGLARLKAAEIGVYAELARLRLLAIEQGDLPSALDEADRKVREILEERKQAEANLGREIESAQDALAADESRRADQQAVVQTASEALDAAEAKAQEALAADETYLAQLARTDQADFVADQAEAKAEAALEDRAVKGKPYEDDPLFSYLWARGFGTSKYRAFPLTRFLDGKVAKLCDYEPARQNYSLLIEIPVRLAEHAKTMREAFDREAEVLAALEDAASDTAGVRELGGRLEEAEQTLTSIDAAIAEREDSIRELFARRRDYVTGEDSYYKHCIEVLSSAMRRKGVRLLEERAARTPEHEDDDLVRELSGIQREAEDIEHTLSAFTKLHDRESIRFGELQDIRRRFKSERFDDSLSEFRDWAIVALILSQFLGGAARSSDLWHAIKRQQRRKPMQANPDFGTLRFPRAPKHGPWRMPGSFGRGGGFGGGGFRTGGGFRGGGGFKTGGGF